MKTLFTLVFFGLFLNLAFGQNAVIDSLEKAQNHQKKGNFKAAIETYEGIANKLQTVDRNKKSEELTVLLKTFMGLGFSHLTQSQYDKASEYFFTTLQIAEKVKDSTNIAKGLNGLGIVYGEKQDFAQSRKYAEQGWLIAKSIDLYTEGVRAMQALALSYAKENPQKAIDMLKQGIEYAEKHQDIDKQASFHSNLANLYGILQQPDKVLFHSKEVLKLEDRPNANLKNKAYAHFVIGRTSEGKQAVEHLEQALVLAQNMQLKNFEKDIRYFLGGSYKTVDPVKGIGLLQQAFEMHDEIMSSEREKIIAELTTKYETEKKEAENKLLTSSLENENLQKKIAILLTVIIFIMAVLGFVLYRRNRTIKIQKLEVEKQAQALENATLKNETLRKETELKTALAEYQSLLESKTATEEELNEASEKINKLEGELKAQRRILQKPTEEGKKEIWAWLVKEQATETALYAKFTEVFPTWEDFLKKELQTAYLTHKQKVALMIMFLGDTQDEARTYLSRKEQSKMDIFAYLLQDDKSPFEYNTLKSRITEFRKKYEDYKSKEQIKKIFENFKPIEP